MSTIPSRRRQNSSAASGRSRGLSLHNRSGSKIPGANNGLSTPIKIDPKSAHTSDPFLQEFLNPAFDPAEYLNATLPVLQGSSSRPLPGRSSLASSSTTNYNAAAVPLADLSTEAQTLLTQLNAHTTRLTNTLSQLTEDILRSGSRLAYEVELLRGETLSLAETLSEGPLRADLERFVPEGIQNAAAAAVTTSQQRRMSLVSNSNTVGGAIPPTPGTAFVDDASQVFPMTPAVAAVQDAEAAATKDTAANDEPPYISHLRTLTLVRSRLDAVIKTFGDAMEFIFPPSEISVSSGFLSVSAPDFPDRHSEGHISTEDKGQQTLKRIRDEISGYLIKDKTTSYDDKVKGVEDATKRIEQIKDLSIVWKGTAEEKGRQRFVESLARMVEDRHRELVKEMEAQREKDVLSRQREEGGGFNISNSARRDQQQQSTGSGSGDNNATATESRGPLGGYGFMNQWQKIRGGL